LSLPETGLYHKIIARKQKKRDKIEVMGSSELLAVNGMLPHRKISTTNNTSFGSDRCFYVMKESVTTLEFRLLPTSALFNYLQKEIDARRLNKFAVTTEANIGERPECRIELTSPTELANEIAQKVIELFTQ
jgi:hypothetical protein